MMDRGTLADASFEALLRVADRFGIDVPDDVSRDELADLVFEAAEEAREERRQTDNHSVRVEEAKYDNRPDGDFNLDESEDIELPDSYNETRIVLLLRDPAWAFSYWDIQNSERDAFQRSPDFEGLMLRVYSLEHPDQDVASCRASFDIPVTINDSRWYINLPSQESIYRIALVAVESAEERVLALSNAIAVPAASINEEQSGGRDQATGDEILAQTGIQDLDLPTNGKRIPQRILDLIDEDLVFN